MRYGLMPIISLHFNRRCPIALIPDCVFAGGNPSAINAWSSRLPGLTVVRIGICSGVMTRAEDRDGIPLLCPLQMRRRDPRIGCRMLGAPGTQVQVMKEHGLRC